LEHGSILYIKAIDVQGKSEMYLFEKYLQYKLIDMVSLPEFKGKKLILKKGGKIK
jgi:hypothetical protein